MYDGLTTRPEHRAEGEMETLSSIIYHEFRCYFVHDGDSRDTFKKNICTAPSTLDTG